MCFGLAPRIFGENAHRHFRVISQRKIEMSKKNLA